MLQFKKASIEDAEYLLMELMRMKNSDECLNIDEIYEFIDRTYFYADERNYIVAIICVVRDLITDYNVFPTHTRVENPNRYRIKYALFNYGLLSLENASPEKIMNSLIREVCASLNDWSVWLDIDYMSSINAGASKEETKEVLKYAATKNYFKAAINRFGYIRVMPIEFDKLH